MNPTKKILKKYLTIIFSIVFFGQCQNASNGELEQTNQSIPVNQATQALKEKTKIKTTPVLQKTFLLQTFATGTLIATQQTEIQSKTTGSLEKLIAQEGKYFKKGSPLAELDKTTLHLELERANLQLEEAIFNKNDHLVLQGGQWAIDSSVNVEVLKNIYIQSGLNKANHAVKQLDYQLSQTTIYAPFDGLVADLEVKPFQQIGTNTTICRLINPNSFVAEFQLLEKEALAIEIGQKVQVSPLSAPDLTLTGTIKLLNPVVNEQGLVRVQAEISENQLRQKRGKIWEGMKLKIVIEKAIRNQLVIPKSALVLRSGRAVVFVFDETEKLAKWKYVTVAYENDSEIAITEGLEVGQLAITEGNLNLDHDAEVLILNE